MSQDYLELSVPVDGEAAEAVCELFERYGGGAVVELRLRAGTDDGADLAVPEARVTTYIAADDVDGRARLEVGLWHLGQLYPIPEATVRMLAEANWAEAWKAHYTPQRIGPFLVLPSWTEAAPQAGERVIRLDPGMAFGTGLHPTTRLCLVALAELVRPLDRVLDVGTGSGILAIGAARCGATELTGLDIDPRAVDTAVANAARNDVVLHGFAGPLGALPPGTWDVVAANLLAGILVDLARELAARTRPGGWLVASGVLAEQADEVDRALQAAGFAAAERRASGDWVALLARRPAAG
jgi:ribosomal protein L11 methyltransferase